MLIIRDYEDFSSDDEELVQATDDAGEYVVRDVMALDRVKTELGYFRFFIHVLTDTGKEKMFDPMGSLWILGLHLGRL